MERECELVSFDQDTEHWSLVFVKMVIKFMVTKKKRCGEGSS